MRTTAAEHVDVLIVGAGLSGIGAACHLEKRSPERSYLVLEGREAMGGTWDLFRYPGVRSDSDMHTLGFSFRPWTDDRVIADGPSILRYIKDTAAEYGVDEKIRYGHKVTAAAWSSEASRWTVTVMRAGGEELTLSASFLFMCCGYYSYDEPYAPEFPGRERFTGPVIHPQHWPEDLDYSGQRVAVIGSGATAITLVPAMAQAAEHVTMVQRSPSYILAIPGEDPMAGRLRRRLSPMAAYQAVRWRNVTVMTGLYRFCRRFPGLATRLLRGGVERQVKDGPAVAKHFVPRYAPWDQRLCFCPDGDFFRSLRRGEASVVTGEIESFTEQGLRMKDGEEIRADIIITATGLNLLLVGGLEVTIDGERLDLSKRLTYKGLMLDGVPNAAMAVGYTNASWTLKADLTAIYVCRVLNHMRDHGYDQAVAVRDEDAVSDTPLIDLESGYVLRALDKLPRQGSAPPWRLRQNYARDSVALRLGRLEDGVLTFSRPGDRASAARVGEAAHAATPDPPAGVGMAPDAPAPTETLNA